MAIFKFELGSQVEIKCSKEQGEVIGRAEYKGITENHYFLRYQENNGGAIEKWWGEDALELQFHNNLQGD